MKMKIEQKLIPWPRYSKYEIVATEDGKRYIRPTEDAHPWPINSVTDRTQLVIDAVNVGIRTLVQSSSYLLLIL